MGENYIEVIKNQATKFKEINKDLDFNKEEVFAIQQFSTNQALSRCDTMSIQLAILNVGLTGLSLNPSLAYAYLIPRKGKCVLDISYRGMIQIAYNAGAIKNIRVELVRANDKFRYDAGSANILMHEPNIFDSTEQRGDIIGVYSVAIYVNSETSICCMSREEVEFVKSKSQAVIAGKDSIWRDWEGEMYKKTVLKRHFKMLPKSEKLLEAVAILNEHEGIEFKKEEKSEITMPEAVKPINNEQDSTHIDAESDTDTETDTESGNAAHGQTGEESVGKPSPRTIAFRIRMQDFKQALTEPVYREYLQNVIGVKKSSEIIESEAQEDALKDIAKYCKELAVKVPEVVHAKQ